MKTKDAFAFRDFNKKKILQRPFFKKIREDYHIGDETDEEILQDLNYRSGSSIEECENFLHITEELLSRIAKYQKFIKRHGERLTKYARTVASKLATDEKADIIILRAKFKRASELSMKYCGCVTDINSVTTFFLGGIAIDDVGGLCDKVAEQYKELDENVKHFYRKTFADRLKFARQRTGLTQKAFAKKIGMSQNGFCQFENGQRDPNIPMLIRLSKILGRSADWLLGQTAW